MLDLSQYKIKINDFFGSLDSLINLIKEKKIDIFTIKLSDIVSQFLKYINNIKESDIEIMSEYLLMTSYLIEIKTKLLLPKENFKINDNYEKNINNELINKLLEYKKIKEICQYFKEKYKKGICYLSKSKTIIKKENLRLPIKININKLTNSFLKLLKRINITKQLELNIFITEEISLEKITNQILFFLSQNNREITFEELLKNFVISLQVFITCFISLLNLSCYQKIKIKQYQYLETIYIKLCL